MTSGNAPDHKHTFHSSSFDIFYFIFFYAKLSAGLNGCGWKAESVPFRGDEAAGYSKRGSSSGGTGFFSADASSPGGLHIPQTTVFN